MLQRMFPNQTTIFKFIDSLKLLESIKSSNLYQLQLGFNANQQLNRKRKADQQREAKIKMFTTQLRKGEISVAVFLEAMSEKDVLSPYGVLK